MSIKTNYGSQIYSSTDREISLSAGRSSFLNLQKVGRISTKNTTKSHVEANKPLSATLIEGSSDISGTVQVVKQEDEDFNGLEIATVFFEIHKNDTYKVVICCMNADAAKLGNYYVDKFSNGFTIMRTNNTKFPLRECKLDFDYFVVD